MLEYLEFVLETSIQTHEDYFSNPSKGITISYWSLRLIRYPFCAAKIYAPPFRALKGIYPNRILSCVCP